MTRRAQVAWYALLVAGPASIVFGELGFWLNGITPRETFPLDLGVSSLAIASGLVLWRLRPDNRSGLLLVLAGILWTIGGIRAYRNPWAFGVGQCFDGSSDLVLAHLLIAYPTGRLGRRSLRALVAAGYGLFVLNVVKRRRWTCRGVSTHSRYGMHPPSIRHSTRSNQLAAPHTRRSPSRLSG